MPALSWSCSGDMASKHSDARPSMEMQRLPIDNGAARPQVNRASDRRLLCPNEGAAATAEVMARAGGLRTKGDAAAAVSRRLQLAAAAGDEAAELVDRHDVCG